jgi:ABC-2 type transport system permease protein
VSATATTAWFARHELRLGWREWRSLMTGGRRRRLWLVAVVLIAFAAIMHLPAWALVASFADAGSASDKRTLIIVTGALILYGSLILSQAMESVTRAFYARADLDLILSAPVSARRVFSVRIGAIALAMVGVAMIMAAPVIDMLALVRGPEWLLGYGVVAAIGALVTAIAVALTIALFRLLGPKRTRLVAQIIAAVIGAAFVIGLQAFAILYYGTFARPSVIVSDGIATMAPEIGSPVWWPARAIMGDPLAAAAVLAASLALLGGAIVLFSDRFGDHALAAASAAALGARQKRRAGGFRADTPRQVLRRKEWVLLRRDSWLISQTLTQLLYLLPPALLLARNFGDTASTLIVIIFAMVAVGGQLAGGLAWLAISGEDTPDLVASAPVTPRTVLAAKVEAVMTAVAIIFAPFVLVLLFIDPAYAAITTAGVAVSALASIRIQLWFRAQAKRSHFRRRHTSSRLATFAEGFSSFAWAGTTGLLATGSYLPATGAAIFAFLILAIARLAAPRRKDA